MKPNLLFPLLLTAAALVSGCHTYNYQILKPADAPVRTVATTPVNLQYDPLQYRLSRQHNRLAMRIFNPTDDRITLTGNRSYVIDPRAESHPVRGRVIGPHSFTDLVLPPEPIYFSYPYYWGGWGGWGWGGWGGWGWGGWGGPVGDGFYNDYYYSPSVWSYQIHTPYDWEWKTGPARLHLAFERDGQAFAHDFEFTRDEAK